MIHSQTRLPVATGDSSIRENHTLQDMEWASEMMGGLDRLFHNQKFCDTTLVTSDGCMFSAHACMLAAASPVLQGVLDSTQNDSHMVTLNNISSHGWRGILTFIYRGELSGSQLMLDDVRNAARQLQMMRLVRLCELYRSRVGGEWHTTDKSAMSVPPNVMVTTSPRGQSKRSPTWNTPVFQETTHQAPPVAAEKIHPQPVMPELVQQPQPVLLDVAKQLHPIVPQIARQPQQAVNQLQQPVVAGKTQQFLAANLPQHVLPRVDDGVVPSQPRHFQQPSLTTGANVEQLKKSAFPHQTYPISSAQESTVHPSKMVQQTAEYYGKKIRICTYRHSAPPYAVQEVSTSFGSYW